jgi:hypothetical protein
MAEIDDDERKKRDQAATELIDELDRLIRSYAKQNDYVDYAILVLSTVTTGAIWLLVGQILPIAAAWVGAIISTVVTVLTILSLTVGFSRKRRQAIDLREDISRFVAEQQMRNFRSDFFWPKHSKYKHELVRLIHGRDG